MPQFMHFRIRFFSLKKPAGISDRDRIDETDNVKSVGSLDLVGSSGL